MKVSTGMKRFLIGSLLAIAILCIALYSSKTAIQAASQPAPPSAQAAPPPASSAPDSPGAKSYEANCAICHGDNREGSLPAFPPLSDLSRHMKDPEITDIIQKGKGKMPGNPDLKGDELAALLHFLATPAAAPAPAPAVASATPASTSSEAGGTLFQLNCAFCHGRDATGGESGPDLTRSKIVAADVNGNTIGEVVREGRPDNKMPPFSFTSPEIESIAAFIHAQAAQATTRPGGRKGVDVSDLQTGNVDAGKQYFNGAGTCSTCHSPSGDLAGIATRYEGLKLEERMLYPRGAISKVTVTLPSGEQISGPLAFRDEFTIALRDSTGAYRSWPAAGVQIKVLSPVDAHVDLFPKYTDADIHNLMAYLQTLR